MNWHDLELAPREPDSYGLPSAKLCMCGRMMLLGEALTTQLCDICLKQGERDLAEAEERAKAKPPRLTDKPVRFTEKSPYDASTGGAKLLKGRWL